jgi:hypothetical protein
VDNSTQADQSLTAELKRVLVAIMFVSERIEKSFRNDKSLHHPIYILTTVDIARYAESYKNNYKTISETLRKTWVAYHRFLFGFPVKWIECVTALLPKLSLYLVGGVDNRNLMGRILTSLQTLSSNVKRGDDFAPELLTRNSSIPYEPQSKGVSISDTAEIDELVKRPRCVFTGQSFMEYRRFFDNEFTVPRAIPFRDRERVEVGLTGSSLVIWNGRGSISFPFFLVYVKVSVNPNRLIVVSPAGSFKLSFEGYNDSVKFDMMRMLLEYEAIAKEEYHEGELGIQTTKTTIYRCLVAFVSSDVKIMRLRLMVVRAGRKQECRDLCYGRIMEWLGDPPAYFNLKVMEMSVDC